MFRDFASSFFPRNVSVIQFKYLNSVLNQSNNNNVWHPSQNSRINTVVMSLSSSWSSNTRITSGKKNSFVMTILVLWSKTYVFQTAVRSWVTQSDKLCDDLQLHTPSPSMCTAPSKDRQSGRTIIIIIIELDPCANLIRPPSNLILEHDTTPFLLNWLDYMLLIEFLSFFTRFVSYYRKKIQQ